MDDLAVTAEPSRPLFRSQNSTRTAIARLFSPQQAASESPSRLPSFQNQSSSPLTYTRNLATGVPPLANHLHNRGLIEGRHSDVTVIAFGHRYALHRLILDRAPFFSSALSPPWLEASAKEITLRPEDADVNITQRTFELALRRLYGFHDLTEEEPERFGMLATGSWLEMQDLIDDSTAAILRSLHTGSLSHAIHMMTANCYGKAGDKILAAANLILSREGSQLPIKYWDAIPAEVVREVISDDGFFSRTEFERWRLAKEILNSRLRCLAAALGVPTKIGKQCRAPRFVRRHYGRLNSYRDHDDDSDSEEEEMTDQGRLWLQLYTHADIQPLFDLLDHGIYYMHLDYDQLLLIKSATDHFGVRVVPEKVTSNALWENLDLRQRILNARGKSSELGLAKPSGHVVPTSFLKMNTSPLQSPRDSARSPTSSIEASPKKSTEPENSGRVIQFWIPWQDCNITFGAGKRPSTYQSMSDKKQASFVQSSGEPSLRDFARATQSTDDGRSMTYTRLPPFRFAAEFSRPQYLKERKRVYSETFFYAGSYWNLYIQKLAPSVRSNKRSRLGFYLHRVRDESPIEDMVNSVDERIQLLERGMSLRNNESGRPWSSYGASDSNARLSVRLGYGAGIGAAGTAGAGNADSNVDDATAHVRAAMQTLMASPNRIPEIHTTPNAARTAYADEDDDIFDPTPSASSPQRDRRHRSHTDDQSKSDDKKQPEPTLPPYVDARPTVKAYFKIYNPSANGRVMNMYQSVPDDFNFSQSWGWKSSSLLTTCDEEELGLGGTGLVGGRASGAWDDDDNGTGFNNSGRKLARLEVDVDEFAGTETDREKDWDVEHGSSALNNGEGKLRFMVVLGVV